MKWIPVRKELPPVNEEFYESDYVLCYDGSQQFVGWYNAKLNSWFVAHHLAESVPLSYSSIPTHWALLPKPPKS